MVSKIKKLMKETAIYGISTILGRFINFLLVPLYTNIFPPEEFGVVANLYAYIGMFSIIYLFGMDSAYLKFASSDEFPDKEKTFSTGFIALLSSSLLISVALAFCAPFIAPAIGIKPELSHLIEYAALIPFLDTLSTLPFISLRLQDKAKEFVKLKTLNIFINIIFNFVLILGLKMGIEAVFISNLIASSIIYAVIFPQIKRQFKFEFDPGVFKRLVRFGLPYLPGGLASMMIQVVDRPIVEKLAGMKALGIYQANYRLGIVMLLFASTFQSAWQPFFLQHQNDSDARSLFARIFTLFSAVGISVILFFSLFINEIATFSISGKSVIGRAYWEGLYIVPVVLLGYFFYGVSVNFSAAFFIKEKSLPVPVITGFACAVNIGANIVLIPVMGIMGAALATLASYLFIALGYYYYLNKMYPLPYEWKKLLLMTGLAAILFTIKYKYITAVPGEVIIKVFMFLLFAGSLFFTGILNTSNLSMILGGVAGKFKRK